MRYLPKIICRLVNDDCVSFLTVAGDELYDLIIADPPYNIGVDYGGGAKKDRRPDYDTWCEEWIGLCRNALKPDGSIWIVSGQEHAADIDIAMRKCGLHMRNRITWQENFGVYCSRKFGRTSRPIFYATKSKTDFKFNAETVMVPSARATKYNDKRASRSGLKIMGDVWTINRVCGTFRERVKGVPTQLPFELVRRIVAVSSIPGDYIFDPFAGSGTTVVVAKEMNRSAVGVELSRKFFDIATKRLEAVGHAAP